MLTPLSVPGVGAEAAGSFDVNFVVVCSCQINHGCRGGLILVLRYSLNAGYHVCHYMG